MKVHNVWSPSGASRWTVCNASPLLTQSYRGLQEALGIPEPEGSPAAREGTAAMAILERRLLDWFAGGTGGFGAAVRKALADGSIDLADVAPDMSAATDTAMAGIVAEADRARPHGVEYRVDIPALRTYGTVDVWFYDADGALTVVDYKHGRGAPVDAEGNHQLALYASGLVAETGAKTARLVVIQPRLGGWKEWKPTPAELDAFIQTMKAAQDRPASFVTGSHCRWCPAASICGARALALRDAKDTAALETVDATRGAVVGGLLTTAKGAVSLVADLETEAKARLKDARDTPGWVLARGPSRTVWLAGAETALEAAYGDAAYARKVLTPAAVRDTLPAGADFIAKHARTIPGGPTLKSKD